MGIYIVRFNSKKEERWGVLHDNEIYPVQKKYDSLKEFLKYGVQEAKEVLKKQENPISVEGVKLLNPVTKPCHIVCQGTNYANHRIEAGLEAKRASTNLFFTKADSGLIGPNEEIIRPSDVQLLDYEIEVGLIIGTEITGKVEVTEENIHQYVSGITIANDITSRDKQFIEGQWYKGKSYRTFCPVGPSIYLLDEDELATLHNLDIELSVNGEIRQSSNTANLLYKPEETLTELSGLMDLSPGDLLLTGTPGGVAMNFTFEEISILQNPHADAKEKNAIIEEQKDKQNYLREGDVIRCGVKTPDGKLNLGRLENKVSDYI